MIGCVLRVSMAVVIGIVATVAASAQKPGGTGERPDAARVSQTALAPLAVDTQATTPVPVHENYRIGAGDVLELRVLGEPEMSAPTVRVSGDGYIQVPFVDEDIRAQCLTERELSMVIAERLKKHLKYPEVHVGVKEFNSIPVAIIGAVNAPGRFRMERRVSLLELITFAGGLRIECGKTVTLVRQSAETVCVDSAVVAGGGDEHVTEIISLKPLLEGEQSQNRLMRPGDIVIVPMADVIYVAGDVTRPNSFPLREGMTFTQALALAGGPTPTAKKGSIRIVRQIPGSERQILPIDLAAIDKKNAPDPLMMPNDVIEVPNSGGKTFFRNFMGALGGSIGNVPVRAIP